MQDKGRRQKNTILLGKLSWENHFKTEEIEENINTDVRELTERTD
jgi:hypothetical protein